MDRSSTVGTGFGVDPAVLAGVANHLAGLAEDAVAGARHESTAAAGGPAVIHLRRDPSGVGAALGAALGASPRLPDWLPDRDAAWQQQRSGLVGATRAAAAALFGTASTYCDVEDRVDPRSPSHHSQVAAAPSAARVSPVAVATAADVLLTDIAEISSAEDGNSLEFAIAVWRQRSTATNNMVRALTGARAAPPGWTGLAATTYTEWLQLHRGQWQALHEDAIRIRDALAAQDTPRPTTTGPAAVAVVLSPAELHHAVSPRRLLMSGEPTPDAPPAGDTAATNSFPSSGPERHPMDPVPTLLTPGTATPPGARICAWANPDPSAPPGLAPASADTDNADSNNTATDEQPARTPTPATAAVATAEPSSPRPGRATDHSAETTSGLTVVDTAAESAGSDPASDDAPPPSDMLTINTGLAAALLGGGIAGGAAAMAAISARPARALHVVPQIAHHTPGGPLVPQAHGPGVATAAPHHRPSAPVVSYPSGPDAHPVGWPDSPMTPPPSTAPLAPPPAAGGIAPPPSAATAGAVPAGRAGLDRDTLGAALDALTNFPGRRTTHAAHARATDHHNHELDDDRRTGLHAALTGSGPRLLLDVGMAGSDPVWLDLAATSGVGVGGPGAAGVTRTLLHLLLTHRRPVTVTAHHDTLAILLADHTAPDPISEALGGTVAPLPAAVISHPWLSVAASSFDILDTAYAEIQRRSHRLILSPQTDAVAGQQPGLSALPMIDPLWMMLVPAPTSGRARQRLAGILDIGRLYGITAIVLGPSDTRPNTGPGTTLLVDPDHRVTHHIVCTGGVDPDTAVDPDTVGGGLTGTQLHPTSPAELRRVLLATALDATDPPGVHSPDADPPPRARISDDHPGAPHAPAAVPGPPAIPQELLPAPPAATPDPMVATAAASRPPATLTVFGETSLRYRAPSDTDDSDAAIPGTRADTAPHDRTHPVDQPCETLDGQIIEGLGPRATELLLFLAVHPGGAARDYLVATLWPDAAGERPSGPFYNLLARIRRTLQTATGGHDLDELIVRTGDKYRLNLHLVATDYTTFLHAATDINHPDPTVRARACATVIHTYRGALGREHTSSEWLLELQLNARYRYLCALTSLAQLTLDTDPDRTLGLLETARLHEPTNEDIYRSIMTIHDHQHRPDAALNTYALLQAHLDNLDNTLTPEPATTALALRIRDTHTQRLRRTPRPA